MGVYTCVYRMGGLRKRIWRKNLYNNRLEREGGRRCVYVGVRGGGGGVRGDGRGEGMVFVCVGCAACDVRACLHKPMLCAEGIQRGGGGKRRP